MGKPNDGGTAFPSEYQYGMSLRDWFAGQALAGYRSISAGYEPSKVAEWSYDDAHAMLARREKEAE